MTDEIRHMHRPAFGASALCEIYVLKQSGQRQTTIPCSTTALSDTSGVTGAIRAVEERIDGRLG
jgi:hypothetical protein